MRDADERALTAWMISSGRKCLRGGNKLGKERKVANGILEVRMVMGMVMGMVEKMERRRKGKVWMTDTCNGVHSFAIIAHQAYA